MNIQINKGNLKDGLTSSHRREKPYDWDGAKVIVTDGKTIYDAMDIRCYYTEARAYACVWLSIPWEEDSILPVHRRVSGSGYAGGYGYNKQDAAIHSAMQAMGIEIDHHEWSPGSGQWTEAAVSIVRQLYPAATGIQLIKTYS